jgi:methyl-accepting chemotaxis protein
VNRGLRGGCPGSAPWPSGPPRQPGRSRALSLTSSKQVSQGVSPVGETGESLPGSWTRSPPSTACVGDKFLGPGTGIQPQPGQHRRQSDGLMVQQNAAMVEEEGTAASHSLQDRSRRAGRAGNSFKVDDAARNAPTRSTPPGPRSMPGPAANRLGPALAGNTAPEGR